MQIYFKRVSNRLSISFAQSLLITSPTSYFSRAPLTTRSRANSRLCRFVAIKLALISPGVKNDFLYSRSSSHTAHARVYMWHVRNYIRRKIVVLPERAPGEKPAAAARSRQLSRGYRYRGREEVTGRMSGSPSHTHIQPRYIREYKSTYSWICIYIRGRVIWDYRYMRPFSCATLLERGRERDECWNHARVWFLRVYNIECVYSMGQEFGINVFWRGRARLYKVVRWLFILKNDGVMWLLRLSLSLGFDVLRALAHIDK